MTVAVAITKAERTTALQSLMVGQTVKLTWPLEWTTRGKTYNYSKGTVVHKATLNGPVVTVEITEGFGIGRRVPVQANAEFTALAVL